MAPIADDEDGTEESKLPWRGGLPPGEPTAGGLKSAVYLAAPSKTEALDLERYLKSGSGRAFLQRHIL